MARLCEAARLNKIINTLPRLFAGYNTRVLLINQNNNTRSQTNRKEKSIDIAQIVVTYISLHLFTGGIIFSVMKRSGVEDHSKDDDLADQDDGHQVSITVKTHRNLGLELEHGVVLILRFNNFPVFFPSV